MHVLLYLAASVFLRALEGEKGIIAGSLPANSRRERCSGLLACICPYRMCGVDTKETYLESKRNKEATTMEKNNPNTI